MSSTTGDAYGESFDVITTIRRAWERGHTLVPLLGAGISVDSGMPLVDSIVEYLVMIRKYVEMLAYRPQYAAKPYARVDKSYREHPIRYIRDYGWPDPFQLRHELMLQYLKLAPMPELTFDQWISNGLDDEVSQLKRWQKAKYQDLVKTIQDKEARYQELVEAIRDQEAKYQDLVKVIQDNEPSYKAPSTWKVLGDWRAVIRDFTEFTLDDADSLFERLYRWHKPGRSHHFWAFLTRLMGLRLFLTTNFDNFLERALTEQGIDHRVFGVEHGDNLPHESLVRETVSVIKLHGDTHRLLLDEKLDYPPGPAYLDRLQACMPRQPIMVVMGCGGNDPRTLEVVKHHGNKNAYTPKIAKDASAPKIPSVIWLHFEPKDDPRTLKDELGNRIQHARVTNPGLFLSHLHAHLRGQHPTSRLPYDTHLAQSIAPLAPGTALLPDHVAEHGNNKNVFIYGPGRVTSAGSAAAVSHVMSNFVYKKKTEERYMPIWINLEAHHSVAGVVQQIVERCRVHDTFVSPFDTRLDDGDHGRAIELTAERLFHILRRGRYVLAFDALDVFRSPPTAHHGSSDKAEDHREIERLFRLLTKLMTDPKLQHEIDVVLCASFARPRDRKDEIQTKIVALFSDLVKSVGTSTSWEDDVVSGHGDDREQAEYSEQFVISCFRRPRSLVSLRSVFEDIFADSPEEANFRIEKLVNEGLLLPTEGGFFRMRRDGRDRIYNRYSNGTETEDIAEIVGESNVDGLMKSVRRCYDLASTHGLVARCYYEDSYLHSHDPWIFFEYFYHRTASLRYITRLVVLLQVAKQHGLMNEPLSVRIPPTSSIKNTKEEKRCSLSTIETYVTGERGALLRSLKHALVQAQGFLLDGLPAAQLEAWCRGVLRDTFLFSIDSKEQVPDVKRCPLLSTSYGDRRPDEPDFVQGVKEIFWTMLGLLRRSLYEQARGDEAARLALSQLGHRAGQPGAELLSLDRGRLDARQVLRWLRDDVKKDPTEKDECVQSLLDSLASRSGQLDRIREVKEHYDANTPNTLLGKQNQLRAMCLLAENRIVDFSEKRFDSRLRYVLSTSDEQQRDNQQTLIDDGLALCRLVSPEGARDSSHDPYYLRFRARLFLARVRLLWLAPKGSEWFCEMDWLVESTRACVSADDHARLARLELTWAEGLLLQANVNLDSGCPDDAAREQALAAARVAYVRAGDALQRAREHLARSGRNVERWAYFQRLWAQYQAEWCLFHLASLESQLRGFKKDNQGNQYQRMHALAEQTPRDMAALLKRLNRGLNGLQAGLVLQPDGAADRGLWRIWLELLSVGMIYGVTTAAGASCYQDLLPETSEEWPLGIESFWEHWCSLNKRAGIPATVEAGEGNYRRYLDEKVRGHSSAPPGWRARMVVSLHAQSTAVSTLRARALELADKLYKCSVSTEFATALTEGIAALVGRSPESTS